MAKNLVFCNFYEELNKNNFMFENTDTLLGDNLLESMHVLKKYAGTKGINVGTVDVMDITTADAIVFIDMPYKTNKYFKLSLKLNKPLYLIIVETELIRKENYEFNNHKYFKKIFIYDDSLIDNVKYFKLCNVSFSFPKFVNKDLSKKQKLCTTIVTNKEADHPLELYSQRVEAIRWFEKNHPEDFDLYGLGWDEYTFRGVLPLRALNKIKFLRRLMSPKFPSYKGKVKRKRPVLEKYKFAICYENARDIPGYITEKIFDCFFAGCVPIYLGANNVTDHIPKNCFIDKRDFDSYEKLYEFIKGMDDITCQQYINNVQEYLNSPMSYEFTAEYFAKTIIKEVLNG